MDRNAADNARPLPPFPPFPPHLAIRTLHAIRSHTLYAIDCRTHPFLLHHDDLLTWNTDGLVSVHRKEFTVPVPIAYIGFIAADPVPRRSWKDCWKLPPPPCTPPWLKDILMPPKED